MDRMKIQQQTVREVMASYLDFAPQKIDYSLEFVVDESKLRFILMSDGWLNHRRLYGPLVDISLRNGKVWILEDNTEEGVTDALLLKGLTRDEIVVAWQPVYRRELTGFAVS